VGCVALVCFCGCFVVFVCGGLWCFATLIGVFGHLHLGWLRVVVFRVVFATFVGDGLGILIPCVYAWWWGFD